MTGTTARSDVDGLRIVDLVRVWVCRTVDDERSRTRSLIHEALHEVAGTSAAGLRLAHRASGQPELRDARGAVSRLEVSLSHGRGVLAVAVSDGPRVGVDVEAVRPLPGAALARRWFTPEEAQWVRDRPRLDQSAAFLALWTMKEAVGKARGQGLSTALLRQPVPLPGPVARELVLQEVPGAAGLAVASARLGDAVLSCASGTSAAGTVLRLRELDERVA